MGEDFYATESRKCAQCGYRIEAGDVVRFDDSGQVIHSKHEES